MFNWISCYIATFILVVILVKQSKDNFEGFESDELQPKSPDEVVIVLFHATWCGHCKRFKPEWDKAKSKLNNTKHNNKNVLLKEVDCSDGENPLASKYEVNGYPTVKVLKHDQPAEDYSGQRSLAGLESFVRAM